MSYGGRRRGQTYVVARAVIRVVAAGAMLVSIGQLMVVGCMWAWFRAAGPIASTQWWFLAAAATMGVVGGALSAVAFGWAA